LIIISSTHLNKMLHSFLPFLDDLM
jgi:hypothetical protein